MSAPGPVPRPRRRGREGQRPRGGLARWLPGVPAASITPPPRHPLPRDTPTWPELSGSSFVLSSVCGQDTKSEKVGGGGQGRAKGGCTTQGAGSRAQRVLCKAPGFTHEEGRKGDRPGAQQPVGVSGGSGRLRVSIWAGGRGLMAPGGALYGRPGPAWPPRSVKGSQDTAHLLEGVGPAPL